MRMNINAKMNVFIIPPFENAYDTLFLITIEVIVYKFYVKLIPENLPVFLGKNFLRSILMNY